MNRTTRTATLAGLTVYLFALTGCGSQSVPSEGHPVTHVTAPTTAQQAATSAPATQAVAAAPTPNTSAEALAAEFVRQGLTDPGVLSALSPRDAMSALSGDVDGTYQDGADAVTDPNSDPGVYFETFAYGLTPLGVDAHSAVIDSITHGVLTATPTGVDVQVNATAHYTISSGTSAGHRLTRTETVTVRMVPNADARPDAPAWVVDSVTTGHTDQAVQ